MRYDAGGWDDHEGGADPLSEIIAQGEYGDDFAARDLSDDEGPALSKSGGSAAGAPQFIPLVGGGLLGGEGPAPSKSVGEQFAPSSPAGAAIGSTVGATVGPLPAFAPSLPFTPPRLPAAATMPPIPQIVVASPGLAPGLVVAPAGPESGYALPLLLPHDRTAPDDPMRTEMVVREFMSLLQSLPRGPSPLLRALGRHHRRRGIAGVVILWNDGRRLVLR